ncbi:hypothetical protein GOB94_09730 [Granulicella sp. 5B5]|uniref:ArnT family glycosyltransferase n=1 Tax=Granulicella sp. 5B5 TaxID=1617967 RepID=UPI0015F5CC57|nr:glycosyltransferase 87 family protein [Granulicella sp. 5B5]QMV18924.1 hypothetical protein GOB94_09730 [Granulicella sp. 5B5]
MSESIERVQERVWEWLGSPRALRWARWLVVALSALFVGLFLWAAVKRMLYPFEVEWIESGMLVSVLRIVHGQGLYVAPTLGYVPYLYTPLYLYVAAGVTKVVGVAGHGALYGYGALRLVSTVASLASAVVIYALVKLETERRVAAIAAAGLYMACYAVVGGFYDIGRVDALFVLLLLVALWLQRKGYPVVAALVWVLAFQTKQTVLPLAVLILLAEWRRPRRMIVAIATFLFVTAASVVWLNHATGGWYGFYIFGVARGLPLVLRQAVLYVPLMVLGPMAAAWATIATALVMTRAWRQQAMFYLFVSVALLGGVWFVEAHKGASGNSLMPVYAWTAVLFGVALARLLEFAEERSTPRLALAVLLAAAVQLGAMIYNPGRFVPPQDAVERSQQFVERLRALPGDVYVLNHSYDAVLAGKEPHAEGEALGAVLDAKLGKTSEDLRAQLDAAMAQHRYSVVVVDALETKDTGWGFEREYPLEISVGLSNYRYLTSQPQWFLLPCDANARTIKLVTREDSVESRTGCVVP